MKPDNGARLDLILDSLAGIPLFDELSDDELKILGQHMHFLEAGAGEMIFEEGEKGNYVCFVADGELA
ncbi:MAG: hypothetical protein QMD09_06370, partial [Desulfatibacillaceae bacterium]|nr:hypothetical protein [Desulfatibacillaceae bacterium]